MLLCIVTKQFCLALFTMECGFVPDWAIQANPNIFICFSVNEISNFVAAMIFLQIQIFHHFSNKLPKTLRLSVPFAKFSPCTSLRIVFGGSLWYRKTVFNTVFCTFLVHQNACFVDLHFLGGWNEYRWILQSKISQLLEIVCICKLNI